MAIGPLYYAAAASIRPLSQGRFLVFLGAEGKHIEISARAAEILKHCRGARPLAEHASLACRSTPAPNADQVATELDRLKAIGLLREMPPRLNPGGSGAASGTIGRLNTVVIVTADRPVALRRCLQRLARNFQQHGRRPRVVVIDASKDERVAAAAVADLRPRMAIEHVGRTAVAELRRMLVARGIPAAVADLSASLGSIGANRNVALLLTAGDDFLMVDDDVVVDTWSHPDRRDGIAIGGHADLRDWRFFSTRSEATADLRYEDVDILESHEALLGKHLSTLYESTDGMDFQHACSHTLLAFSQPNQLRVRGTFAGLAGDSARYCAHRLLFASGTVRARLLSDPSSFATALTSREIRHIATETFITHEPIGCASYCMGFSNTPMSPPFMPISRSEDTVFASTLAFVDPDALFAHLPLGIIHDSARPAGLDDAMPSARETTMAEHLQYVLQQTTRHTFAGDAAKRLDSYGAMLTAFADMPDREFSHTLHEVAVGARCQQIAMLDAALTNPCFPDCWRTAFENYRSVFAAAAAGPAFHIPAECASHSTVETGLQDTRRFMRCAGQLVQSWQDVWRAAALAAYRA